MPEDELVTVDLELGAAYPVFSAGQLLLQVTELRKGMKSAVPFADRAVVARAWISSTVPS